jgi:hypothetical protein
VVVLLLLAGCARTPPGPEAPAPAAACAPVETPLFRDMTEHSGVRFTYRNGEEADQFAILEVMGGGLAAFDFDGDGLLDLFVVGGGYFDGPDRTQIKGLPCRLYRNRGDFRFEDVTAGAGLDTIDFYSHGAFVCDFDNDGWPDLLVTGWGRLALFHNEPVDAGDPAKGRRFADVTRKAGLPAGLWTTGAAWGDLDGDGFADLYLCQYADWSFGHNHPTNCRNDDNGLREICAPKRFTGLEHRLYRNRGDGTFEDVSKQAGLRVARTDAEYDQLDWLSPVGRRRLKDSVTTGDARFGKGLAALMVDVNNDGRPDVYVTNDAVDKFLYVNRTTRPGRIQLEEIGLASGTALSAQGTPDASMGVDAADYNGSGRASLWCTNFANELHGLYRNECRAGNEIFLHSSTGAGIGSARHPTVGWGTAFADFSHRGWEDVFVTAGDAYRRSSKFPLAQLPLLLENEQGKFRDVTDRGGPYFRTAHRGRGAVVADFDNDGRLDLAVSHLNEPVAVLRNQADTGGRHWLGIELRGAGGRDVVGARIVLEAGGRKQTRFAKSGNSYLSSCDRRHVFGLGQTGEVGGLTVVWPSGKEQKWGGLGVDRYWRLTEGRTRPEPLVARE